MNKKLDVMYMSLFALTDMALKYKADPKYTKSIIGNVLFFAWVDGLIDCRQYEHLIKLSEKDFEGFHSCMLKHVDFD